MPPQVFGITLFSQGFLQAVIKAPPVMAEPGNIVHVAGARDVTIRHFTITGPLPDHLFCSLATRTGVRVDGGGSATLTDNHVAEIRSASPLLRGCQNGIAVLVGRAFEGQTGRAEIRQNLIDRYQKGAVVVDNAGSYGDVHHNEITGNSFTLAGAAGTGIILFQAHGAGLTVGYNDVYRNDDGIALSDVDGPLIETTG